MKRAGTTSSATACSSSKRRRTCHHPQLRTRQPRSVSLLPHRSPRAPPPVPAPPCLPIRLPNLTSHQQEKHGTRLEAIQITCTTIVRPEKADVSKRVAGETYPPGSHHRNLDRAQFECDLDECLGARKQGGRPQLPVSHLLDGAFRPGVRGGETNAYPDLAYRPLISSTLPSVLASCGSSPT